MYFYSISSCPKMMACRQILLLAQVQDLSRRRGEEGHDNAAILAARDGARVMFIMPRHCSHKSCIAPRSWEKGIFLARTSCPWGPDDLLALRRSTWPSHFPYPMRISHFYIVSCPIDFTTSTLTLLLFISFYLWIIFLFNKGLSRVWPLMPQCLSSLIWRQLWPNNKTSCLPLKHIAWQTGEKKPERSASSPFIQSASLERRQQKV